MKEVGLLLLASLMVATSSGAQGPAPCETHCSSDGFSGGGVVGGQCIDEGCGPTPTGSPAYCTNQPCNSFQGCREPMVSGPFFEAVPEGGGQYKVRMMVEVTAPFNEAMAGSNPNGTLDVLWWKSSSVPFPPFSTNFCELLTSDRTKSWVELSGFNCGNVPQNRGTFTVRAQVCGGPGVSCGRAKDLAGLAFLVTPGMIPGCPPPMTCNEPGGGGASGAAGSSCPLCRPVGGGGDPACSVPLGGGGPACSPAGSGPGAHLRYAAGGVGGDGFPGTAAWRVALGRYWSHDYAERIVVDPDAGNVWLLTRYGSFRRFTGLDAGTGLRLYRGVSPSDEFRRLYYDTPTSSWQLRSLDGRTDYFRADGLWEKAVLASDPGHPIQTSYTGGQLTSVSFPDGRSETFAYHPTGKLASITAVPVAGTGTAPRIWTYDWSGEDLQRIARPDGTAWEFAYDPTRPGYLLQVRLVGTDLTSRVEAAFEYEPGSFNVQKSWRGDPSFAGSLAVGKTSYAYTPAGSPLPSSVTVAEEIRPGAPTSGFTRTTTTTIGRDTASAKPRVAGVQGSCPVCLSPNSSFTYAGANPLLPSSAIDPKGTRTDFTYNTNGRLVTRTEAANVPDLTRVTSFFYDANFPGLTARIEQPSTAGGSSLRTTEFTFDPVTGLPSSRTIDGFEGGAPLPSGYKTTSYTYNASGEPLSIDPPGFGTSDVTAFTYGLPGRNGHVADTRTDPVIGVTTFGYDGYNRRTSVTDPNGVETTTAYDPLDRMLEVRQKGATTPDDLVTRSLYNVFGDLFCTRLPRGNGIEYRYDAAGRMSEMIRGMVVSSPTSTSCLDPAEARERTVFAYDTAGNRTEERLEGWNGTAWVESAFKSFTYSCHLDATATGRGAETSTTEFCYDLNDNLEQVWDANHPRGSFPAERTVYGYDALNRLTTVTQRWGGAGGGTAVTTYTYDPQDHLQSVTDANGNMTLYETSDRDLLTEEASPVFSGATSFTAYVFDEHGNQVQKTDPRGVTELRQHDSADRVTRVDLPGSDLDTAYLYDAVSIPFSKGRLTSIVRPGSTVAYEYDRLGRTTRDGALGFTHDANGNRRTIAYSPSVGLCYDYDALDRPVALRHTASGGDPCLGSALVSSAAYLPSGPLASLALGNGLTETRLFDTRYFPDRIEVPGRLDWDYTVDAMGNVTSIADGGTGNRIYGYQDHQYFLTSAVGPWGNLGWSYDKIGNRLSETQSGEPLPLVYSYLPNGTGGNNPKLTRIEPRPHGNGTGSITYGYDSAGNQTTQVSAGLEGSGRTTTFSYSGESRLSQLTAAPGNAVTTFQYDGRGYLREALLTYGGSGDFERTEPTYASEGLLFSRRWRRQRTFGTPQDTSPPPTIVSDETAHVFYFAGRPVAQLTTGASGPGSGLVYLTADHLGTQVLATDSVGATLWSGGFTPFGASYQLMPPSLFLRLPGQWTDSSWEWAGGGIYYNLYRWYEAETGRYTKPDPIGLDASRRAELFGLPAGNLFAYTDGNPITRFDPLGASWYDWVPGVTYVKCVYYTNRCIREIECCLRATGLGNLYSGDEEQIAARFNRFGGRWSPQWVECFQKTESCEPWIKYCGKSAQRRPPGTGKDPGAAPPILSP